MLLCYHECIRPTENILKSKYNKKMSLNEMSVAGGTPKLTTTSNVKANNTIVRALLVSVNQ
jgi:hypothetical protein